MLVQGEILTLDDNREYTVVRGLKIDDIPYVYLIDINDYTNVMFCKYNEDNSLEEVTDNKMLEKLIVSFRRVLNQDLF